MNNVRFLKILIVALVLIDIGTIAFIWMRHGGIGVHNGQRRETPFTFLVREVNMDDSQVAQYKELREKHHQGMLQYEQTGRELNKKLFMLLSATPIDTNAAAEIANAIADNQRKIELHTFYHFAEVRKICRPEQQQKFDQVIQEAINMMLHQGPPNPHDRSGQQGPPDGDRPPPPGDAGPPPPGDRR